MIPTLWSTLFDGDRLPPDTLKRLHQSDTMAAMRLELRGLGDPSLVHAAETAVEDALKHALQQPLLDILGPVWRSHSELPRALESARQHPGFVLFEMGEHDVFSTHRPRVEVVGPAGVLAAYAFEVRLEIILQSAALRIAHDGALSLAAVGACRCETSLELDDQELAIAVREDVAFPEAAPIDDTLAIESDHPSGNNHRH